MTDLRLGFVAPGLLAGLLAGCGLVSSDVTNFDLTLPDKTFTVDTSSWQVDDQAAMTFLQTSCASAPAVCSSAAEMACAMNCSGECNANTQTCDLTLEVALHQPVNLVEERPELKSINDEPVIKVTIDSVTYEVTQNSLNVATPPMQLYVAPISVMDPNDPQAKEIGTIEAAAPGFVTDGPQDIAFTATGKAELIDMMSTYQTPFNVLVGSTLVVTAGQPVPTGKLAAVVHIKAHAGL